MSVVWQMPFHTKQKKEGNSRAGVEQPLGLLENRMDIFAVILGLTCLAYFATMLSVGMDFSVIWLLAAVLMIGGGGWCRYAKITHKTMPMPLKITCRMVILVCVVAFVAIEGLIVSHMYDKGKDSLDYVIVLGAQVRGDTPSKALKKRIHKAKVYLEENPETIAVLSGGQGKGENITEAQAMYDVLVKDGIPAERLIMEDKSTSTVENLEYSAKITGKTGKIGLITQNFHLYRALKLAEHQGYEQVCGIAAPSEAMYQPHFMVREAFAIVKELLCGNIKLW